MNAKFVCTNRALLGLAIRSFRVAVKLTQQDVADKLSVTHGTYSRVETGYLSPQVDFLE